ncbi:MAG: hypothetical protein DRJ01_12070 [Bacteroidetes bacterium]|nr:MAG: hypothetical protein DRJ01_12070 [Bacteroidota bacterium]
MKIRNLLTTALILLIIISCEKDDNDLNIGNQAGFSLHINDSIVYNSNQIDFYDFSSHLIYLKNGNSFSYSNRGVFKVFVNNSEIYTGQMFPGYSSYLPMGPVIHCAPTFYGDYIIPIGFNQFIDSVGDSNEDPRNDSRIIETLKKNNQYREGLSCEILSVQKISSNNVKINLQLTNNDSDNLLYLDPDKMGLGLFHYYTNGLLLQDLSNKTFMHQLTIAQPDPWDTWENDWLSIITSNESKTISIIYDNFETITTGQFEAFFNFPGLGSQVDKEDLQQDNGRVWLGQLQMKKKIEFE